MEIAVALTQAARELNLSDTQIGAAVGVSELSVRAWRTGKSIPKGTHLIILVRTYPRFASIIGLQVA